MARWLVFLGLLGVNLSGGAVAMGSQQAPELRSSKPPEAMSPRARAEADAAKQLTALRLPSDAKEVHGDQSARGALGPASATTSIPS